MAYPSVNPLKCSIAVFEAYVERSEKMKALLEGRWDDMMSLQDRSGFDNRTIILQARLPTFFKNPFEDD